MTWSKSQSEHVPEGTSTAKTSSIYPWLARDRRGWYVVDPNAPWPEEERKRWLVTELNAGHLRLGLDDEAAWP